MRASTVRRRAVLLTLALALLALGPVLYAAATPSGSATAGPPSLTGTLTKVDLAHHHIALKVAKGAAKYKGKVVTLNVKGSAPGATSVTRLGHKGKLIGLKKDDRVVVTYKLNANKRLVAIKVTDSGPAPKSGGSPSPTPSYTYTYSYPPPTDTASPSPSITVPPDATVIHMSNFSFSPSTLSVPAGTTVYSEIDSGLHTWTAGNYPTSAGTFDSNDASVYSYTFPSSTPPGTYPFFCKHHGGSHHMTGSITITAPAP